MRSNPKCDACFGSGYQGGSMSAGSCDVCGGSGIYVPPVMDCGCESPLEHSLLVEKVNDSWLKEPERDSLRFARTTAFLRAQITRELNGG